MAALFFAMGVLARSERAEFARHDLRGRRLLPFRECLQPVDERQIRLPVFRCEARDDVAEVRAVERRLLVDFPGEKTFAERAERYEANPELLENGKDFFFRLAPP